MFETSESRDSVPDFVLSSLQLNSNEYMFELSTLSSEEYATSQAFEIHNLKLVFRNLTVQIISKHHVLYFLSEQTSLMSHKPHIVAHLSINLSK